MNIRKYDNGKTKNILTQFENGNEPHYVPP